MNKIDFQIAKVLSLLMLGISVVVYGGLFIVQLIIYIRATQQQCFPDVTFVEFTYIKTLLITTMLAPIIMFIIVTAVLYLQKLPKPKVRIFKGSFDKLPFPTFTINPKVKEVGSKIGLWFLYLYWTAFVIGGVCVIGSLFYSLFFGDPCTLID